MYQKYRLDVTGVPKTESLSEDAQKLYAALEKLWSTDSDANGNITTKNPDLAESATIKEYKISKLLKELKANGYIEVKYENIENAEGKIRRLRWISLLKRENNDNTEDNFEW